MLPRFFGYFGSKHRSAKRYPKPRHKVIVEPFAGSCGYSLRHHHHKVILIERNPVIASIWRWLIEEATPQDILDLPVEITDLREMDLEDPARWMIGLLFEISPNKPANKHTNWSGERGIRIAGAWGIEQRSNISMNLSFIKHWLILEGDYSIAEEFVDGPATWFVDPPYQYVGKDYPCGRGGIDYYNLSKWCQSLNGQVIVCEGKGANWLPFRPLGRIQSAANSKTPKRNLELIWCSEEKDYPPPPPTGFFTEGM